MPRIAALHLGARLALLWVIASSVAPWLPAFAEEPSVLVKLEPAHLQAMRETLTAYGTVEYAPEHAQVLDVQAEGLVSQVRVAAGQRVNQGDVLLELTATVNAKTELEHARIAAEFARKDVQRLRDLRSRQLATNAEVQTAEENLAKANSVLTNVVQRLGSGNKRELRASMNGVVEAINVHEGDIAAAGTPLVRLTQGDRLRVRLGVEPEDLPHIREGQNVRVAPLYSDARTVDGQVLHIYYQVDPRTRLAEVVVPLVAAPDLLPGAVVRGAITLNERVQVLAVPRQAVLNRNGRPYVFIADHGHARLCWVETGLDDGNLVEIRSGLQVNDPVVVLGNYELQDGMAFRTDGPP